jgi:glutathione S-transferase
VIWLLEELNLEYEIKVFKRNAEFRAGADLKAVHPLGRSPTIGITPAGSEKEIIIAESATIVEYICEHFGRDKHMIPQRYPEDEEGVLGAETEDWMRYRVRLLFPKVDSGERWLNQLKTVKMSTVADGFSFK